MSEYHLEPDYGRDDYGTWCKTCDEFVQNEEPFCSWECEDLWEEAKCSLCGTHPSEDGEKEWDRINGKSVCGPCREEL